MVMIVGPLTCLLAQAIPDQPPIFIILSMNKSMGGGGGVGGGGVTEPGQMEHQGGIEPGPSVYTNDTYIITCTSLLHRSSNCSHITCYL